jgi:hypothetical protein
VHADTIDDVLTMYQRDLHLTPADIRRLGLIINIGLVGRSYPAKRRWFSTHFIQPVVDPDQSSDIVPIPLSLWNSFDDTFEHADEAVLAELAGWMGLSSSDFHATLTQRVNCLKSISQHGGLNTEKMYEAISNVRNA